MKQTKPFDADGRQATSLSTLVRPIRVTIEDEVEFQVAVEAYKNQSGRNFPTWSEILELLRALGYSKRIWRPVGSWSAISTEPISNGEDAEGSLGVIGWYSRVETPVGP